MIYEPKIIGRHLTISVCSLVLLGIMDLTLYYIKKETQVDFPYSFFKKMKGSAKCNQIKELLYVDLVVYKSFDN